MFTRAKKFYEDKKDTIVKVSSGIAIGSTIAAYCIYKEMQGREIADASLYKDVHKDTQFLRIDYKNGKARNYLWDPERTD